MKGLIFTGFILLAFSTILVGQESLNVLNSWVKYQNASGFLHLYLSEEAFDLLDSRARSISTLKYRENWVKRKEEVKKKIWEAVGGRFEEKTPLNVRTINKQQKKGYILENLIYESLPGYYVTASLFIPDNIMKPAPAILFCTGHSWPAFRRDIYQLPLLNLVKKGFIVLAFDPVGQGERLQYYDYEQEKSIFPSSTKEHSYPSPQVALLGQSVARYFIQDGIQGIDYLLSREEVDGKRIGVHGLSGGGTQTAYIAALDDRVTAASSAGYITSYKRLISSVGVQDGEQNFYRGIAKGIDHADLVEAMAPKPFQIIATTRDFFSVQGARETYEELQKVYEIYGKARDIELVEDDHVHGYTKKNREEMYAFFQKHLDLPGSAEEEKIEYLTAAELQKTPSGQLITSLGGESVYTLNFREWGQKRKDLEKLRQKPVEEYVEIVKASAKYRSGYKEPKNGEPSVFTGRYQEKGFVIEKYFLKGEGEYVIPYVKLIPEERNGKSLIYLHPQGKSSVTKDSLAMKLLKEGVMIFAPDLLGIGELENKSLKGDAYIEDVSFNIWYLAMQVGRSIVGIQAGDIVRLVREIQREIPQEIYGIAYEGMAPALSHAAVFEPVIRGITLVRPYGSYASFVENLKYNVSFLYGLVPGSLPKYDLPDLWATLAPRKLLFLGVTDSQGRDYTENQLGQELHITEETYKALGGEIALEIRPWGMVWRMWPELKAWMGDER